MNKTKVLCIRIKENDLQLLQAAAESEDLSVSSMIRKVSREYAQCVLGGVDREKETENTGNTTDE